MKATKLLSIALLLSTTGARAELECKQVCGPPILYFLPAGKVLIPMWNPNCRQVCVEKPPKKERKP